MTNNEAIRSLPPGRARVESLRAAVDRLDSIVSTIDRLDAVVAALAAIGQPTTTEALIKRTKLLAERDSLRDEVLAAIVTQARREVL